MAMRLEAVGTAAEIEKAELDYAEDPCETTEYYLGYIKAEQLLGNITGYPSFFNVEVFEGDALVRANTWGSLYAPLTSFLEVNNIAWDEY